MELAHRTRWLLEPVLELGLEPAEPVPERARLATLDPACRALKLAREPVAARGWQAAFRRPVRARAPRLEARLRQPQAPRVVARDVEIAGGAQNVSGCLEVRVDSPHARLRAASELERDAGTANRRAQVVDLIIAQAAVRAVQKLPELL